jgi:protein-S-isoprenylcysteine O-methyltransferase Ste14
MIIMIEWINLGFLLLSAILYLFFYVKSAGPAQLEQKIGESAYSKCARYRTIAAVFSFIAVADYIVYYFYPIPIGLPRFFPWDWWISVVIGIIIVLPSMYLMYIGTRDAGEEAMVPKKEHTLYGGIYETIRHPQAIGEFFLWFSIAFWLNSPFLVLISFLWIPIYYLMCLAEEKDLVIRYGQSYLEYRDRVGFLIPKREKK